ncbi:unnamed protein product, partial [Chrysoparadoxa australica]
FDLIGNGVIDPSDVVELYNPSQHPSVLAGILTEEDVARDFLETFEVGGEVDGLVTREEWGRYFASLGATIEDDDEFRMIMVGTFGLDEDGGLGYHAKGMPEQMQQQRLGQGQGRQDELPQHRTLRHQLHKSADEEEQEGLMDGSQVSPEDAAVARAGAGTVLQRNAPEQGIGPFASGAAGKTSPGRAEPVVWSYGTQGLVDRILRDLLGSGTRGVSQLRNACRAADTAGTGLLTLGQLKDVFRSLGLTATGREIGMLLAHLDPASTGRVCADKFVSSLLPCMSSRRQEVVTWAFHFIAKRHLRGAALGHGREDDDAALSARVDASDFVESFNPRGHPDVVLGKLREDEALEEFLESFEVSDLDGKVSLEEFEQYCNDLSAGIADDDLFERLVTGCWGLETKGDGSPGQLVVVRHGNGSHTMEEVHAADEGSVMSDLRDQGIDAASAAPLDISQAASCLAASIPIGSGYRSSGTRERPKGARSKEDLVTARLGPRPGDGKEPRGPVELAALPGSASSRQGMSFGLLSVLQRIREELYGRGVGGVVGLSRAFALSDTDNSGDLSLMEFKRTLRRLGMGLSEAEVRMLFQHFDADSSGDIDVREFLHLLRPPLGGKRLEAVKLAFSRLDADGMGSIGAQELAAQYDASCHPEVLAGRITPEECYAEFLSTFDAPANGQVTRQDFINYYTDASASIASDGYFVLMVCSVWHVGGPATTSTPPAGAIPNAADSNTPGGRAAEAAERSARDHGRTMNSIMHAGYAKPGRAGAAAPFNDHAHLPHVPGAGYTLARPSAAPGVLPGTVPVGEPGQPKTGKAFIRRAGAPPPHGLQPVLRRVKAELAARGVKGMVGLERTFRDLDKDGNETLCLGEFKAGLAKMCVPLPEAEARLLFEHFDADGSGSVSLSELVAGLREPMPEERLALAEEAFDRIDAEGCGLIDPKDLAACYDTSKHPEVIAGRLTDEDAFQELLDTFSGGSETEGKITKGEFCQYYSNYSATVHSDRYFYLLMRCWKRNGNAQAGRAGFSDGDGSDSGWAGSQTSEAQASRVSVAGSAASGKAGQSPVKKSLLECVQEQEGGSVTAVESSVQALQGDGSSVYMDDAVASAECSEQGRTGSATSRQHLSSVDGGGDGHGGGSFAWGAAPGDEGQKHAAGSARNSPSRSAPSQLLRRELLRQMRESHVTFDNYENTTEPPQTARQAPAPFATDADEPLPAEALATIGNHTRRRSFAVTPGADSFASSFSPGVSFLTQEQKQEDSECHALPPSAAPWAEDEPVLPPPPLQTLAELGGSRRMAENLASKAALKRCSAALPTGPEGVRALEGLERQLKCGGQEAVDLARMGEVLHMAMPAADVEGAFRMLESGGEVHVESLMDALRPRLSKRRQVAAESVFAKLAKHTSRDGSPACLCRDLMELKHSAYDERAWVSFVQRCGEMVERGEFLGHFANVGAMVDDRDFEKALNSLVRAKKLPADRSRRFLEPAL